MPSALRRAPTASCERPRRWAISASGTPPAYSRVSWASSDARQRAAIAVGRSGGDRVVGFGAESLDGAKRGRRIAGVGDQSRPGPRVRFASKQDPQRVRPLGEQHIPNVPVQKQLPADGAPLRAHVQVVGESNDAGVHDQASFRQQDAGRGDRGPRRCRTWAAPGPMLPPALARSAAAQERTSRRGEARRDLRLPWAGSTPVDKSDSRGQGPLPWAGSTPVGGSTLSAMGRPDSAVRDAPGELEVRPAALRAGVWLGWLSIAAVLAGLVLGLPARHRLVLVALIAS